MGGGGIFLAPNFFGGIGFNFFPPGGKSQLGVTENYLEGVCP